ncbi:MAG: CPBP family intramembrane glutamic endopeptidase [Anaeromyxobacteraceae bacterium]
MLEHLATAVYATLRSVRTHPLAAFLATAFAFSWSDWLSLAASGARIVPGHLPTDMAGMVGPAFAAFFVTAVGAGETGLKDLGLRMLRFPWRSPWFWLLAPAPLWVALAVASVLPLLGHAAPPPSSFARYPGLPAMPLVSVFDLVLVGVGFGQEVGWRGFLLPRLQQRLGPLRGAVAVAPVWGLWVLPLLVVNRAWVPADGWLLVPLAGSAVLIVSASVVLAFLVARTGGSILGAALWHASLRMTTVTDGGKGLVGATVVASTLIAAVGLVAVEYGMRRRGRSLLGSG